MANRVFQNVVYQMKDAIDRVVGVAVSYTHLTLPTTERV